MFVFKGVNVFPPQIECAVDAVDGLGPYYHIRLERDGYVDTATLFVELNRPKELLRNNALPISRNGAFVMSIRALP